MAINAGPNQIVESGERVGLQTTGALDSTWTQNSGPVVNLTKTSSNRHVFIAPRLPTVSELSFTASSDGYSGVGANSSLDVNLNGWNFWNGALTRDVQVYRSSPASAKFDVPTGMAHSGLFYYFWLNNYGALITNRVWIRTSNNVPVNSAFVWCCTRDPNTWDPIASSAQIQFAATNNVWVPVDITWTPVGSDNEIIIEFSGNSEAFAIHIDDVSISGLPSSDSCSVTVRPHEHFKKVSGIWVPI